MLLYAKWQENLNLVDRTEKFQASVGLGLSLVILALLTVVIPIRHLFNALTNFQLFVAFLSYSMIVVSSVSIWRKPGDIFGRLLLIAGLLLIIPFAAYYHGGLIAPVMPLTMLLPLLAFFLLGRKFAIAVLVFSLVMFVSIYLLKRSELIPEVVVDSLQRERTRMLIFSAIAVLAFAIGCIYEVYRKRMQAFEILVAEQVAIKTMVTTYSHEINNPLAIAIGQIELIALKAEDDQESLKSLHSSLLRIKDVSRKIHTLSESVDRQKEVLYGETEIFKLF